MNVTSILELFRSCTAARKSIACTSLACFTAGMFAVSMAFAPSPVQAAMISGFSADGDPVSATADFSQSGDTLTVVLTNTTSTTQSADELLTGIDFMIMAGGDPDLTSAEGVERLVNSDGSYTELSLTDFTDSWSLIDSPLYSDTHRLNFNPNAKHAIIGPANGALYESANGSIKSNPGHNPFVAETATFEIDVPGLSGATAPFIAVKAFLFGTNLTPVEGEGGGPPPIIPNGPLEIPEPGSVALAGIAVLALLGIRSRR